MLHRKISAVQDFNFSTVEFGNKQYLIICNTVYEEVYILVFGYL